jgi:transposase
MSGDRIEMSQRERDRLKVMSLVMVGERSQVEAGRLLDVTPRTIRRWRRRLEAEGDAGIVRRLRGRNSNAPKCPTFRRQVLRICAEDYCGSGPTLAAEKLTERGLAISAETLRG